MKHLKLFENNQQRVYMVIMTPPTEKNTYETSYALFSNEESAKNYILNSINDDIEGEDLYFEDVEIYEYEGKKLFLDYDEAIDFVNENISDLWTYTIETQTIEDKVELDKEILLARDINKYNI